MKTHPDISCHDELTRRMCKYQSDERKIVLTPASLIILSILLQNLSRDDALSLLIINFIGPFWFSIASRKSSKELKEIFHGYVEAER